MICPNINSPEWKNLVAKIGEEQAWKEFLTYRTIPDASNYELIGDKVYFSIKTKSTEEIAKDLDSKLIRSKNEIKYTERIIVNVLNELGELTPGVKLKVSPSQAFNNVKNLYQQAFAKFNAFKQQLLTSKDAFEALKKSDSYKEVLAKFPELGLVDSYEDFLQATSTYEEIVKNYEQYKKRVTAELLRRGIKLKKNSLDSTPIEDKKNKEADQTDEAEISQQELGERFDTSSFEVNFRDTASPRVKAFVYAIEQRKRNETTGNYDFVNENGIPIYADQEDVFSDLLSAGSEMALSEYSTLQDKLSVFKVAIQKRKDARPYLQSLLDKISDLETKNRWDKINDILTFASKAYAVETLMTYKTRREGRNVVKISNVKEFASNRDTVENQVANLWLVQHLDSGFYAKNAAGELKPKKEKVDKLGTIITEAQSLRGDDQVKKFIEFFDVLGIQITPADMVYIQKHLPNEIKRGNNTIASLFSKNGMLDQIFNSYKKNLDVPFEDQYGLTDEKNNLLKLAKLYYDANPGRFVIASSRTADGKQKYLFIEPSYIENMKRRFTSAQVTSTALGAPNEEFWIGVQKGNNVFKLQYFNGIREEESPLEGKVRKSLTSKEQAVTMMLKHQAQMDTGTYINFTLSDKTTTIETKMSKMFFVNTKSTPLGLGADFTIADGRIKPTEQLNKKIYNSFVEPEISRILAAIKYGDKINLEKFDFASRLFYFIPSINSDPNLSEFRDDVYSGKLSLKELEDKYSDFIGAFVFEELYKSSDSRVNDHIKNGIIKLSNDKKEYTFPLANTAYVNILKSTGLKGRNLALLMMLDMEMNYHNAQVKMIQFSKFDPYLTFKTPKQYKLPASFAEMQPADKVRTVNATWDEFSKRAAALIAPGRQGNFSWTLSDGTKYQSTDYKAITAEDFEIEINNIKNTTTDGQEFVTLQEHIDVLLSEGKIPFDIWESIYSKIQKAKPGGFYLLSDKELGYVFSPQKPVHVGSPMEGEGTGLNRIDYVKSSRYPLIPEIEAGSERDKVRVWMEKNGISSLNFASTKKLGRPSVSVSLFDKDGNFTEPSVDDTAKATQILERAGLRTQQEIPSQKDEIRVVSQMNRTILDNLLQDSFKMGEKSMKGSELKNLKEDVRSKLFELEAQKLRDRIGDLSLSHRGLYEAFKDVILNDTSGSYSENDLKALEIDPATSKFKYPLEAHFKGNKLQALFNSMIEKNVMLKIEGSSFVQVSAVGSKFTFSQLGKGIKSRIIWLDTYAKKFSKDKPASLKYISKNNNKVEPAQVIVSQYIRDAEGNLVDLTKYVKEKDGILILDTANLSPKIFELVATRIPNQSHPSMLPIQVVGFLPGFMENTIIVPDGITGQMGSDFDVDKLYTYFSKLDYTYKDQKEIDQLEDKISDLQSQIADKINDRTRIVEDLTSVDHFRINELIEEKNKLKDNLDKSKTNKRKAKKRVYYFERMSEINAELSTLFDSISSLNLLDKSNLEEIQNLKKQVRDAYDQIDNYKKPENITKINPVTYSNEDLDNLSDLSEEQLVQLYRDIHWTVLTHPSAYSKITSSIDSDAVKSKLKSRSDLLAKYKIATAKDSTLPLSFATSISRYEDNRSGKIGVGVFANLISAQADFQDKIIRLGSYENGVPVDRPIKFKYSKKSAPIDLLYIGQTGASKTNGLTISGNLNVMFSESVDNAKNLNLREFNWNQNAMSAVGFLMMLTDESNNSVPVEFAMDLTSQGAMVTLFEMIDQKQDSFGEFDSKALETSVGELQESIETTINKRGLIPQNQSFGEYFKNLPEDQKVLDPETLSLSWLVHKAKGIEDQQEKEQTLKKIAKDYGYKSADDLELNYYITQYIALDLFKELNQLGKDYQSILSGVYTYTKGIGASVFETNQKLRYLNKLVSSPRFLDTKNIAGEITLNTSNNTLLLEEPKGEIGYAIKNSLLFAQEQYKKIYPIISGPIFESIVTKLFFQLGFTSIDEVGKSKWIEYNQDIFNNLISYLYTLPELGLFDNPGQTRDKLINGKTSIAYRVTEAIKDPKIANNGFLKYIDVKKKSKKGRDTYQIMMKSPFGGELDENLIRSGFFELALSDSEDLRQLAKDIAIYPYLTGDAGKFGRFIPVEYLLSDADFAEGLSKLHESFYSTFVEPQDVDNFVQQVIQNSPQDYATNFYFSHHSGQFSYESPFRKVFKNSIGNKESLKEISQFTIRRADFNSEKTSGIFKQLSVKLPQAAVEQLTKEITGLDLAKELVSSLVVDIKYPDYIAITDSYTNDADYGQYKIQYLYKRTSSIIDGILTGGATYERINVLGYGTIKEFDLGNPDLKSAIKDNNNVEDFVTPTILESSTGETAKPTISSTESESNDPSQYTNHSGGAKGYDAEWDLIGAEFGMVNNKHYLLPSDGQVSDPRLQAKGVKPVDATKDVGEVALQGPAKGEAQIAVTNAERTMGRIDSNHVTRNTKKIRNYAQVKNADGVFAIGSLIPKGADITVARGQSIKKALVPQVNGGTSVAVQLGITMGKPTYVFNQVANTTYAQGWYKWDSTQKDFVQVETPVLTKNFAGIGTSSNTTEQGKQAIRDVYAKTFGQPQVAQVQGVEISSNAKGLAAALTNPTELAKQKGNLAQSYPVNFRGKQYADAEEAYQALKATATKDEGPNSTYNLMVEIIKAKLEQHPRLSKEITKQGGSTWILASTHQPTNKNTVWETGGKNWFIKALNEAYQSVYQPQAAQPVLSESKKADIERRRQEDIIKSGLASELAGVIKTRLRESGVNQEERNKLTGTRENPIIELAVNEDYIKLIESYKNSKEKQLKDFEEGGKEEGKFIPEKGIFLSSDVSFFDKKIDIINKINAEYDAELAALSQPQAAQPAAQSATEQASVKTYKGKIETLQPNQVFVFGSNPEGRHGIGAAKTAQDKFGAQYGNGRGLQGQSYALVTKNLKAGYTEKSTGITYDKAGERSVSVSQIQANIRELYETAKQNPDKEFVVAYSAAGKNLNGYTPQEMANMFSSAEIPSNMVFEEGFSKLLGKPAAAQSVIEQADKLPPIEQNFTDGQGGRKMQPQFAGKSTMDLILSGDRTRTTRAKTDVNRMIKDYGLSKIEDLVGRVIRMTDKTGRVAYTKITNVVPFTQEYQDQTWQKEGWEKSVTDKLVGDYPYAIEFELLNKPADDESQVEEDKDELVFYGGKNFMISDGQIFYTNTSLEKTKLVEDPGLTQKILLTSMINKDADKVVKINVGGKTLSYYYASPDHIYSLQDTSFGELMVGADTIKRVTEEYNKPLHERNLSQAAVESPILEETANPATEKKETKSKFEFTYNGVTVPTEFQLTKEQSDALIKLIDFVNTKLISESNIQNEFDNTYTLEGYAGTGKTSIIGIMDQYFKKASGSHTAFIYAAPTHAATVALGINVVKYGAKLLPMTVQASVNMRYNPELGKKTSAFTKKFNERTSIRNIFVIDESSMLDPEQVSLIIKAAHVSGVKVIFMGDPKQIPAVTPGVKQKTLSKAFANPNKVELKTVHRTKDNNILTLLTDIRSSINYKEREFESTDKLVQVPRNEYNEMLYNDLQSDPANTVILNYTNEGVTRANSWARDVLGFGGELKVGEIIVGYIGNQMKQIEKGHLANSVQYVVRNIDKRDDGQVIISASSPKLTELRNLGITNIPEGTTFTYLALDKQNKLEIPVTDKQIEKNKKRIADIIRPIHELNQLYNNGKNSRISYLAYLAGVENARAKLTDLNIDRDYIFNPASDTIEQYDRLRHKELKENLKLEKGIDFGYAITVHKSQGMTIPNVYFDTTSLSVVGDVKIVRDNQLFNTEANAIYYVGMSRASNKLVVPKHTKGELSENSSTDSFDLLSLLVENDKSDLSEQITISLFGDKQETSDYKQFLNEVYKNASPFYRQLLGAIGKFNALKPVKFVLDNTIDNPALYDAKTATIKLNIKKLVDQGNDIVSMKSSVYDGIMHELFHHLTVSLLTADPAKLTADQKKWVTSLKNLREFVLDKMMADPAHQKKIEAALTRLKNEGYMSEADKSIYYGLFNVEEFVSMMMSDKNFQTMLNDMTYDGEKSVWQRFLDILSSILKSIGFQVKDDSVLKEGITSVMGLVQSSTEGNLNDNPNESYSSIAVDSSRLAYFKNNLNTILEEYNIQKVC